MSNKNKPIVLMHATKKMYQLGASRTQTVSLVLDWWDMDWGKEYYIQVKGDSVIGEPELKNYTTPDYVERVNEWIAFYKQLGREIREGNIGTDTSFNININIKKIKLIIEYVTAEQHEAVSTLLGLQHKKDE